MKSKKGTKTARKAERREAHQKLHEEFRVEGEELLKKVKELIKKGNVRKITIKDKKGKEIMSIPLTIGVVGALIAPALAAIGAVAALVTECTVVVERK
jgi:hypothetical protein